MHVDYQQPFTDYFSQTIEYCFHRNYFFNLESFIDSVEAATSKYCIFTDYQFCWTRCDCVGYLFKHMFMFYLGPRDLPNSPFFLHKLACSLNDSLLNPLVIEYLEHLLSSANRFGPYWQMDCSFAPFIHIVQGQPLVRRIRASVWTSWPSGPEASRRCDQLYHFVECPPTIF